ncbi:SDR family NAD(P)-dependent oxidoreductase [Pontixanthobacter aquaemixtae]|uniref:Probable oxidoreductase n=1 Tax=Pontixanthobacter aquaemixtae TaxID=1958940 RepID=A0A844ZV98_9SPHN|nr:SDR family NAD(P)-dependent oxidoreductase [Pontixanthobacter aquaemixtae]MXO91795.1 SDR family NAD(P)-dependent oxidoreductase [Pontixanthobacter aquaemixtae]
MSTFGATTTADEALEGHDLSGKLAFITGGASGLGQETARAMAAKGAHVVIAARDQAKLDEASAAIKEGSGNEKVETILCDLASLDSVRACAKEAGERFDKIDLLINNAGVMACPLMRTADGFEMQFGTNHVGHFLLTNLLMPLVLAGTDKRIVNLSSRGHFFDEVHHDDPNYESREYEKWAAYGQSKTANIQFSVGLESRLADQGIHSYAVHPGGILTNLGRHMTDEDREWMMSRFKKSAGESDGETPSGFKTIPQGAATTCVAATASDLAGKGGVYLEDCNVSAVDDENEKSGVRSYALDPAKADELWAISEQMVGQKFAY